VACNKRLNPPATTDIMPKIIDLLAFVSAFVTETAENPQEGHFVSVGFTAPPQFSQKAFPFPFSAPQFKQISWFSLRASPQFLQYIDFLQSVCALNVFFYIVINAENKAPIIANAYTKINIPIAMIDDMIATTQYATVPAEKQRAMVDSSFNLFFLKSLIESISDTMLKGSPIVVPNIMVEKKLAMLSITASKLFFCDATASSLTAVFSVAISSFEISAPQVRQIFSFSLITAPQFLQFIIKFLLKIEIYILFFIITRKEIL
jgi:hypothetical protein